MVGVEEGMAGIAFRLQDLYTVDGAVSEDQDKQDAVDVVQYSSLTFQIRRPVATTLGGSVIIQEAAVLDDAAFTDTTVSFSMTTTSNEVVKYTSPLRYIRWRYNSGASGSGSGQFMIDVVARESS